MIPDIYKYKLFRIHALTDRNPLVIDFLSYTEPHREKVLELSKLVGIPSRGEIHDLDKYEPSRIIAYAKYHNADDKSLLSADDIKNYESHHTDHVRNNDHHPQYWYDKDRIMYFEAWLEMICDWISASMCQNKHYKSSDNLKFYLNDDRKLLDPLPGIKEATEEFLHRYAEDINEFNILSLRSIYDKYVHR